MAKFRDEQITQAILAAYHQKLGDAVTSDVLIVGAGPSGLTAAICLREHGVKVTILERHLSPGGGVWGGGMGMNEVVVQEDALSMLDDIGVRYVAKDTGLYTMDAVELASGLSFKAVRSGAVVLNLMTAEDVCVHDQRVTGVVANRSTISGVLHVDPVMFAARAVLDGTGHDAAVVHYLQKRGLLERFQSTGLAGEAPMNAVAGEEFVVRNVAEVYPGLWVTGMSVCAVFGGPRMGPIFGGMLLSGQRVADQILKALR